MNETTGLPPVIGSSMQVHLDYCNKNSKESDGVSDAMASLVRRLGSEYQKFHGYISIVICLLGVASNLANIVVLTRPRMRRSPTNFLLTSLAVADLVTMTSYMPYAIYFYCVSTPDVTSAHARTSIVFLIVVTNLVITAHTAAVWLTVAVAAFRYLAVRHSRDGGGTGSVESSLTSAGQISNMRRMRQVRMVTTGVLLTTAVLCAPNYMLYKPIELSSVQRQVGLDGDAVDSSDAVSQSVIVDGLPTRESSTYECVSLNATDGYWFTDNIFVTARHKTINFWLYGVTLKICPCIILTVVSVLLVRTVRYAERQHLRVQRSSASTSTQATRRRLEHARTTAMLVAVALCFVIAELPQGVFAFWSGIDPSVFGRFYVPLGDIWDLVSLINSAVNFVLYCTMSRYFRCTFVDVFYCVDSGTTSAQKDGVNRNNCRQHQQQQQLRLIITAPNTRTAPFAELTQNVTCDVTDTVL